MKIFDKDGKTNFVDDRNLVVGYDRGQDCCEWHGYFISETLPDACGDESAPFDKEYVEAQRVKYTDEILAQYQFDSNWFFQQGVGAVHFKLNKWPSPNNQELPAILYLTLFNIHNGYYSHGFTVEYYHREIRAGNI